MKKILLTSSLFTCNFIFAQQKKDTTDLLNFEFRHYDITPCQTCPLKPGDKVPYAHPYAKYINDESLWEWREIDLGVGKPQKVYDLKPQYKDTLRCNDGTIMEVPFWIKNNSKKNRKTTP